MGSGTKSAATLLVPIGSGAVEVVATLDDVNATVAKSTPLFLKVTVPQRGVDPPLTRVTVAVSVPIRPYADGLGFVEVRVVTVGCGASVNVICASNRLPIARR